MATMSQTARYNDALTAVLKKGEQYVDFSAMDLDDAKLEIVLSAMQSGSRAHASLNVSHNRITSVGAIALAAFLREHAVSEVYLSDNAIDDDGARALLEVFRGTHEGVREALAAGPATPPPSKLDVRHNPCSEQLTARLELLARCGDALNATLREALLDGRAGHVSFADAPYSNVDLRLLRYVLHEVRELRSVDFSRSAAGDAGAVAIGELLRDSAVERLSMRKCGLSAAGVFAFIDAAALAQHPHLRELDFAHNIGITNEVSAQLATRVFDHNDRIVAWDFSETSMTGDARAVVEEECELNTQPPALKRAVVAVRRQLPSSADVDLQWEQGMSQCMRFLWRGLRLSGVVARLNVSNSGIDDGAIDLLVRALARNTSLRVLELANNKLTTAGVTQLAEVLARGQCGVCEVNVANNNLDNGAATALIAALRANPALTVVNIDVNPRITDAFALEIAGLLAVNRAPAAVRTLLPQLERDAPTLTAVDLSGKDVVLNDEAVRLLCRALQVNTHVTSLDLSNNLIGDTGAVDLAELLVATHTLRTLTLARNSIGNRGTARLCDALYTNTSLTQLDLSDNVLDAEGVAGFGDMLRHNHVMRGVQLERTRVPGDVRVGIARACDLNREPPQAKLVYYRLLDGDPTLTAVDLRGGVVQWPLDDASVQLLCTAMTGTSLVRQVNFAGNKITAVGCGHIAAMLADAKCAIVTLDLADNPIDDFGVAALCEALPRNTSLSDISLRVSAAPGLSRVALELLTRALKQNDTLRSVVLPSDLLPPTDATATTTSARTPGSSERHAAAVAFARQMTLNNEPLSLKKLLLRLEAGEDLDEVSLREQNEFGDTACRLLCDTLVDVQRAARAGNGTTHRGSNGNGALVPAQKNSISSNGNNAAVGDGSRTLRTLDLSHNKLTSASVPYVCEVMEEYPTLSVVDLAHNAIDDRGGVQLIACLERVPHVRVCGVRGNPLSSAMQERMAQLLTMNMSSHRLKHVLLQQAHGAPLDAMLDFSGATDAYKLSDEEVVQLAGALREARDVRVLDLTHNAFGDRGCIALAEVLRVNHTIEAVHLDHNDIGADGGEALFYALKINPQLHTLTLTHTHVPQEVLEDILGLLHVNQTPLRERRNLRGLPLQEVDDTVQFKSTDYFVSQAQNLEDEALHVCKRTKQLLVE